MQRGKHREIRGRKWRLAGFSFGKLFVHVFVTTKYEMKEEKVQVGVQSRERKSIGKDGRGQLHAPPVPPEPSLVLPEVTAGEGRYSPHFFCVRLHLNATLWTHWNLCFLPSEHPAPGTSLSIACHSSSQLLVFFPPSTPVLFSAELCSLVPGTWRVANKCWVNELSRKTKTPKFQNKLSVIGRVVGMKKISFKVMRYLCSDSLSFLWHFTAGPTFDLSYLFSSPSFLSFFF